MLVAPDLLRNLLEWTKIYFLQSVRYKIWSERHGYFDFKSLNFRSNASAICAICMLYSV